MEFTLSALVSVASFSRSLVWIDFISLVSGCVWWVGCCCCSFVLRVATDLLYVSKLQIHILAFVL
jgi:hypothetical protein